MNLPDRVNDDAFNMESVEMIGDRNKFMKYMRAYCDMCFEEFWLRRSGLIDTHIWTVWESGMRVAFSRPAFRQAWSIIGDDSDFGAEFHTFIDGMAGVSTRRRKVDDLGESAKQPYHPMTSS